ncbi:ATP-binding protein [Crocinitomicaceae bacterium]|nr:ATP-binding protein [Crocinitomicaceae bacterium]MDC0099367.1 ATP-binding protein [Crocinitomicaceae bacterium]MDC1196115.1 ATP-binding protein [Crocinitomicaceae bacterium]MDC1283109.1 ATP-binding protein [Crocinitomicaceae bacterium]MDC1385009.1 ATP-binding protein [Crocinitomicaceae bacterium]
MNRRTALIFYILSVYVVVQFIWWGYHLIELTNELNIESRLIYQRVTMIMGEGAVFLLLLLAGIWNIRRTIKKELLLSNRQKNFLLSVTHELKTPLAANKLYIQTVRKRDLSKEQTNEILQKSIDENTRLERMIDNILNASRLENKALPPTKEQFDLSRLIDQVKIRFNTISGVSNIKIEVKQGLQINADYQMTETILNNLVENALKYAGKIEDVIIYARKEGAQMVFGVRDLGPGVLKEHKSEVFTKFFRAENEETRSQKGTGLGLYIVAKLITIQNGTIACMDNEPKGTDFQIKM